MNLNSRGRVLPVLDWGCRYNRDNLTDDGLAAVIVTIMLIPQSLAYALLAGLPPEAGLYASILPILLYAIFGTSRALAVGPVRDVVFMCSAINEIGLSAVEALEEINKRLKEMGIRLHLSEVKGPVMDRLCRAHFLSDLTGKVFMAQYDAFTALSPDTVAGNQAKPVMS